MYTAREGLLGGGGGVNYERTIKPIISNEAVLNQYTASVTVTNL